MFALFLYKTNNYFVIEHKQSKNSVQRKQRVIQQ